MRLQWWWATPRSSRWVGAHVCSCACRATASCAAAGCKRHPPAQSLSHAFRACLQSMQKLEQDTKTLMKWHQHAIGFVSCASLVAAYALLMGM